MSRRRRPSRDPRGMEWMPPEDPSGYDGPATLVLGERSIDVTVHLDGHLEPLDGRFHWYGRIERSGPAAAAKDAGATTGLLVVDHREPAEFRLAEYDPWGHIQVGGVGTPPYPVDPVQVELPSRF